MQKPSKNAKRLFPFALAGALMLLGMGCREDNFNANSDCIEGIIPNDTLYRAIHEGCFSNSIWMEVLNKDDLGKDVNIFTPSPGEQPNFPIQYKNIVEILLTGQFFESNQLDTLLGKKIYFNYRFATEEEISAMRNSECTEVYDTYDIPILILTHLSFDGCPKTTDF